MDFEQTLETQRLRLLRIVAALVVAVGVLALGPVSRGFSEWTLGFVGSILSRAEAAARYLLIAQARSMVFRSNSDLDTHQIFEMFAPDLAPDETDVSLSEYQRRLKALHAVLMDLPFHAARLLRRFEKQMRRAAGSKGQLSRLPHLDQSPLFCAWHLTANRIERPPDKCATITPRIVSTPSGFRAGGVVG